MRKLVSNSEHYQKMVKANSCYAMTSSDFQVNSISADEFLWLYGERLVKSVPGKIVYGTLLQNATYGLCSYCQYHAAKTLDHFVPKSLVPTLAIDPWNLIPSCWDCNHSLSNFFGASPHEEFLHPFFMPDIGRWLFAEVRETSPPTLLFWAEPGQNLSSPLRSRIIHQFDRLKLAMLYPIVSTSDLIQIASHADMLSSPALRRAHFHEMADAGRSTGENSRKAVIYDALASSEWFCEEGYTLFF
jgi:hypothetical protein